MSQFMPDQPAERQPSTPPKGPEEYLAPEERRFLQRYLSFPEDIPPKFKSWLIDFIAVNIPQIPISQIVGFPRVGISAIYAPTWTSQGTQPSIGNGTITGRYIKVGNLVAALATVTMGSSTTFGSGVYFLSLPVPALDTAGHGGRAGLLFDSSASSFAISLPYIETTAKMTLWVEKGVISGFITPTNPWTWASGDILRGSIVYESGN